MDHSKHIRLSEAELNEAKLMDAKVYGLNDEKGGTVSHMHGMGTSAEVVIDVGGFLGIGAKPVAVPVSQLDFMYDESGEVHAVTSWTKDDLKKPAGTPPLTQQSPAPPSASVWEPAPYPAKNVRSVRLSLRKPGCRVSQPVALAVPRSNTAGTNDRITQ